MENKIQLMHLSGAKVYAASDIFKRIEKYEKKVYTSPDGSNWKYGLMRLDSSFDLPLHDGKSVEHVKADNYVGIMVELSAAVQDALSGFHAPGGVNLKIHNYPSSLYDEHMLLIRFSAESIIASRYVLVSEADLLQFINAELRATEV